MVFKNLTIYHKIKEVTMIENQKTYDALLQIASIANQAIQGQSPETNNDSPGTQNDSSYVGCTIKPVPERLMKRAADTAIYINPTNSPILETMMGMAADMVSDPQFLTVLTTKYWGPTPRRLTVSFMETTPADLRRRILSHMNAWSRTACISFVETTGRGNVRISRGGGGYWSYLGTDILQIPANRPTMNLQDFSMNTRESEFVRVVRHETGHTLGFPHEHMRQELVNRIDPQKAYDYFMRTQGWNRTMVDQQVLTALDVRSIFGTPADQTSIMCYQLPGSITKDGKAITGGIDINATDFAFAGRIYPRTTPFSAQKDKSATEEQWPEAEDVSEVEIQDLLKETVVKANGFQIAG
jgi:hypothetical protein